MRRSEHTISGFPITAWTSGEILVIYGKRNRRSVRSILMHVDIFDWDDEEEPNGNTRHIISAGYEPEDIEDAIRAHRGPVGRTRETNRPLIVADIDGEETYVVFEIEADDDIVIVTPVTAFPVED
jgi:hypothetical protein